ncbi:hypothetical protein BpHYR1_010007 [Brachionus plicatilis]|uniref:Uncharacterized protein n=1 Tax=Brachionus plicatilis TaxID=10195 RepID=A0A3M7PRU2_BRAPC|nr:hypothetical protein BpHYR1_010007 [Brachionus plicatilis]
MCDSLFDHFVHMKVFLLSEDYLQSKWSHTPVKKGSMGSLLLGRNWHFHLKDSLRSLAAVKFELIFVFFQSKNINLNESFSSYSSKDSSTESYEIVTRENLQATLTCTSNQAQAQVENVQLVQLIIYPLGTKSKFGFILFGTNNIENGKIIRENNQFFNVSRPKLIKNLYKFGLYFLEKILNSESIFILKKRCRKEHDKNKIECRMVQLSKLHQLTKKAVLFKIFKKFHNQLHNFEILYFNLAHLMK